MEGWLKWEETGNQDVKRILISDLCGRGEVEEVHLIIESTAK